MTGSNRVEWRGGNGEEISEENQEGKEGKGQAGKGGRDS
jgi:hypothetical protein